MKSVSIKSLSAFVSLSALIAFSSCTKESHENSKSEAASSTLSTDQVGMSEPAPVNDAVPRAALSIIEFIKLNRDSPTGFSLPCQNGQKEFRRVNEEKKIDLRFCSHDGKAAAPPMLRVGKDINTLQASTYRATISHGTQDLTWVMNAGTVVNYAASIKEWKVMHKQGALTFKEGEKCALTKELKQELEKAYGASFCRL